jgi:hypothetical protein
MSEARFGGRRAAFIDGTAACLKTGAEFQGPMAPRSVSPMPESRREMVNRGRLFEVPTYRWLPAKSRIEVQYDVFINHDSP